MAKLTGYKRLPVDFAALGANHSAAIDAGTGYGWGAKDAGKKTPESLGTIDCSGYVGWLLYKATKGAVDICGTGTYTQSVYWESNGFKVSNVASGALCDNVLRVAVMVADSAHNAGHTCLILNGRTMESHGGKGCDSREWTGEGWQRYAKVYCLAEEKTA